jgi:hypothetical protein
VSATAPPYQYLILHASCKNHLGVLAVQAAHAAGESCLAGAAPSDTRVVALVADKSDELVALSKALHAAEPPIPHVLIVEPDPPYQGAATALGIMPTRDRERVRAFVAHFPILK